MVFPFLSARGRARARAAGLFGGLALVLAGACSENLETGAACPALCPVANEAVRDTVLTPVVADTAIGGVPIAGDASVLLLAVRPGADSLDVRAVLRFDSLPAKYAPPTGGDSIPITSVQQSALFLRVDSAGTAFGAARGRTPAAPVTVEAYDVDTAGVVDTLPAVLASLFRPDRRLGAVTVAAGAAFADTLIRVPLSDAAVAARAGRRLRVGVRLVSADAAQLRVFGGNASGVFGSLAPALRFDPSTADTSTAQLRVGLASSTPAEPTLAAAYVEQQVIARAARAPLGTDLVVGGVPARRTLLRFAVPARFVDSVNLVRATLELVQRPAPGSNALDSVTVRPLAVLATEAVTDPVRASELAAAIGINPVRLAPGAEGVREVPVVRLLTAWRGLPANTQRALVLRAELEGAQASEVRFYSVEAPAELRPRLRLSYVSRAPFGIP